MELELLLAESGSLTCGVRVTVVSQVCQGDRFGNKEGLKLGHVNIEILSTMVISVWSLEMSKLDS